MVMADVEENGGLTLNKKSWVEFPKGYRSHQILKGGGCSMDSFCYPSVCACRWVIGQRLDPG